MEIGLFYASSTCYTEMVAEKIAAALQPLTVHLHNLRDQPLADVRRYPVLLFGISTWDYGELQEDWASHWSELADLDLDGRIVALFGLGDQSGYGEWFVDALGMLHEQLLAHRVQLIGYWPNSADYQFNASKALTDDGQYFVGLVLDEENQYALSEQRIARWCQQLKAELAELAAPSA